LDLSECGSAGCSEKHVTELVRRAEANNVRQFGDLFREGGREKVAE